MQKTEKMKHVMVDIETMGNRPGAAIIAIAAVMFDPETGETGASYYNRINLESAVEEGLQMDVSTVLWWMKQSEEARNTLMESQCDIEDILLDFEVWLKVNADVAKLHVWANSPGFDLVLLEVAYRKVLKKETCWKFYNELDVRTINWMMPHVRKNIPFEGTKHDPLHDCLHQIACVSHIVGATKKALEEQYISNVSMIKERAPGTKSEEEAQ